MRRHFVTDIKNRRVYYYNYTQASTHPLILGDTCTASGSNPILFAPYFSALLKGDILSRPLHFHYFFPTCSLTCYSVSSESQITETAIRSYFVVAVGIRITRRRRTTAFVDV